MEAILERQGLQLLDVPSKGSCFFIALANRLFGSRIAEPDPEAKELELPTVLRILSAVYLSDSGNVAKCDFLASHGLSHRDNIAQELTFAMKASKASGLVERKATWSEYLEVFSKTGALIAETFHVASLTLLFDLRLSIRTCFDSRATKPTMTMYEPASDKQYLVTLNNLLLPFGIAVEPTGAIRGMICVTLARSQIHYQIVHKNESTPVPAFKVITLRPYSK
jgi:hypothetical protein